MCDNDLHDVHKSAYRKSHSTETALVKIFDDVLSAVDNKECVLLVMLDQSAAFDTVNQDILLHRLKTKFGVRDEALAWLQSYFKGRSQSVFIKGISSKPKELGTGLPQGSVLGPNKYPKYSSPLFMFAKKYNVCMHMYADDTQLYVSFSADEGADAKRRLEDCITEIRQWMGKNHLKLNDSKTEFLIFGNPCIHSQIDGISSISVGNTSVDAVDSAKKHWCSFR